MSIASLPVAQRRAEIYLFLITLIWGSTFVVTKALLENASPLLYTAIRFLLAAGITAAVFHKRMHTRSPGVIRGGVLLGVLLFGGFALQTVGLQYTTASKSAFFTGMLVVFTPIVHYVVQHFSPVGRKALKVGNIVAVFLATLGLYLLTSPSGGGFTFGDLLTLGCALLFAFYIVYLDSVPEKTDKMQLTVFMFLVCGLLGLLSAVVFESMVFSLTSEVILSFFYLTVFATVLAMGVQNRYQSDTTPTRAALIFSVEPVAAAVFAFFVRGEILGTLGIIGGMVMIAGVLLSEFSDTIPGLNRTIR